MKQFKRVTLTATMGLIAANMVVFVGIVCLSGTPAAYTIACIFALPDSASELLGRPWTLLTYSIAQTNVLQLLFNMLWLYCFGRIFEMLHKPWTLIGLYAAAAAVGGAMFVGLYPLLDDTIGGMLMGSSAAVIALAVCVAFETPSTELHLPLLGPTKVCYIVIVAVLLFCIGLSANNAGGNIAHLGGAIAGAAAGLYFRRSHRRSSARIHGRQSAEFQKISEHIRRGGFESLSARERKRFFELSRNK